MVWVFIERAVCCYVKLGVLAGWNGVSCGPRKAAWSAEPVCSAVSLLCFQCTLILALDLRSHFSPDFNRALQKADLLLWPLSYNSAVSADSRCNFFFFTFFIWHLQVVVITVPLSSRICECLVPYFDSSSPDSRNVSLVPGCVLFFYSPRVPWLVFGFILKYCLTACILLINMRQEPNNVPWQWCKTVDFSCFTP